MIRQVRIRWKQFNGFAGIVFEIADHGNDRLAVFYHLEVKQNIEIAAAKWMKNALD